MSDADDRDRFASEWLDDARADLAMAVGLLTLDDIEPWGIAFHAHQAVEKAFKAVLARAGSAVPRTHDLVDLAGRLPDRATSPLDDDDLDRLTDYAVATRYPIDDWAAQLRPSRDEARRAVNDASKVIIEVDRHLTVPGTGRPDKSE